MRPQLLIRQCGGQEGHWIKASKIPVKIATIIAQGDKNMKGNFGAMVLILIGIVALAVNLGALDINFVQLIRTWWPLLLIVLGVGMFFTPNDDSKKNSH